MQGREHAHFDVNPRWQVVFFTMAGRFFLRWQVVFGRRQPGVTDELALFFRMADRSACEHAGCCCGTWQTTTTEPQAESHDIR